MGRKPTCRTLRRRVQRHIRAALRPVAVGHERGEAALMSDQRRCRRRKHPRQCRRQCGVERGECRSNHKQPKGSEMTTSNAIRYVTATILLCLCCTVPPAASAQERPYTFGSVWNLSLIKVKPGMFDVYMNEILPLRKKINEEAKKQGLILSSRILTGAASGRDDWDLVILDEYKNWAAFDGLAAKFDEIQSKIIGTEEKQTQLMLKRSDVREIFGNKVMQQIDIK
jgi:hypothetical protein